jgi:uncharacterized protein with HEPN domain
MRPEQLYLQDIVDAAKAINRFISSTTRTKFAHEYTET